jgi:alpha-tubulin suppressor-like RCC1 family protein
MFTKLRRALSLIIATALLAGILPTTAFAVTTENAPRFTQVVGGTRSFVALGTDGKVYAWGYNSDGQLGLGDTIDRNVPTYVAFPTQDAIVEVAGQADSFFALTESGQVYSWGYNGNGALGLGFVSIVESTPSLVKLPEGIQATHLYGGFYSLFVSTTNSGVYYAWGTNGSAQLGTGTASSYEATPVLSTVLSGFNSVDIAQIDMAGNAGALLTTVGEVYTWGANDQGQLGRFVATGAPAYDATIGQVTSLLTGGTLLPPVNQIAVSRNNIVALTDVGIYIWGNGTYGQIGNGSAPIDYSAKFQPLFLENQPLDVNGIATTRDKIYVFTASDEVWVSGNNSSGALGVASPLAPIRTLTKSESLSGLGLSADLMPGDGSAITPFIQPATGIIYAVGSNLNGALGNGTDSTDLTPRTTPEIVGINPLTGESVVAPEATVTVAGTPTPGVTIKAKVGGFWSEETTLTYSWYDGENEIATTSTLAVTSDLLGKTLMVKVKEVDPDINHPGEQFAWVTIEDINLNIDTDYDGVPDVNIDTDDDGNPDLNIDTNDDLIPDTNIDTDDNGKPDTNIIAVVTAGQGGNATGSGTYDKGATVAITATPQAGWVFVKWVNTSTNAPLAVAASLKDASAASTTFVMPEGEVYLAAQFAKETVTTPEDKDVTPPAPPTIDKPTAGDTTITGKGEPGGTVTVKVGGKTITGKIGSDGKFSVKVPAVKAGQTVTVTVTDKAGNVSAATKVKVEATYGLDKPTGDYTNLAVIASALVLALLAVMALRKKEQA